MSPISYFITLLITFLSLFLGFLLIIIAPEEKKPGERYFNLLYYFFLSLIAIGVLIYRIDILSIILAIILVADVIFIKSQKIRFYIVPIVLALIFYSSSKNTQLFLIVSSLIVLYGLATGSIMTVYRKKTQSIIRILSHNIPYVIIATLLYFIAY